MIYICLLVNITLHSKNDFLDLIEMNLMKQISLRFTKKNQEFSSQSMPKQNFVLTGDATFSVPSVPGD